MLDPAQARAYAAADFSAPHDRFVALYKKMFTRSRPGVVLDLGCGPGDICIRFARAFPKSRILGLDGSPAMLREGARRLRAEAPALRRRIALKRALLPDERIRGRFSVVISNSLLHHLHDPRVLWDAVRRYAAPGARIFIVDLRRARDAAHARQLTRRYAASEPAVLQRDFYNSLLAAFTPSEIRAQLRAAGLGSLRVRVVSDRHVAIWGRAR